MKKHFDNERDALLWLSQFHMSPIIGSSDIDAKNYKEVGIFWGKDSEPGGVTAELISSKNIPQADLKSGRARLFGGRSMQASDVAKSIVVSIFKHSV